MRAQGLEVVERILRPGDERTLDRSDRVNGGALKVESGR
jgi:hypothetical protein